jgi:hypothetical protein
MTKHEIIKHLKANNPYPVDVFTEPSEEDWKRAWKLIAEAGIVPDRIAGKWGRMVWDNAVNQLEELLNE